MHAAPLTSPRLQQVLAVNAWVSELRHHGAEIACTKQATAQGWRFYYTMTRAPRG